MRMLANAGGLVLVYALTLASVAPADLALGAGLGAALAGTLGTRLRLDPRGKAPPPPVARLVAWPLFAAAVLADVAHGTWQVGLRVLHVRPLGRPGLVRVPMAERSERGVAVSAHATTLSPGSVLIDLDWERRDILLHVIDASDPERVRERLQRFYDRYQRRVFP